MDFRRKKFFLALGIMAVGMAIALVWHGWQGWGLHRVYPYNTFLYRPDRRFADLTDVTAAAKLPSPYQFSRGTYFPASYVFYRWLGQLSDSTSTFLYLGVSCLGLWAVLILALRPLFFIPKGFLYSELSAILAATGLMLVSYPLFMALDRANLEFIMAVLVALALFCFYHRQHGLGLTSLLPAICFKLYPALLLVLFLRPRYFLKIFVVAVFFVVITFLSLESFANSIGVNLALWQEKMAYSKTYYLIHDGGLGATASPWTTCRVLVKTFFYAVFGFPSGVKIVLMDDFVEKLFGLYTFLTDLCLLLGILYVVLIEMEFFRRAIILLLLMTEAVPYGGEYRLLYINIAMVILILQPGRRKYDLLAVALLAFVAVPKREIYLSYLGTSDTGIYDISIGGFLNPPCILIALGLLIWSGWPEKPWAHIRARVVRDIKATCRLLCKRRKKRLIHLVVQ